jgi:polysaccharide biosynthesis transport protein
MPEQMQSLPRNIMDNLAPASILGNRLYPTIALILGMTVVFGTSLSTVACPSHRSGSSLASGRRTIYFDRLPNHPWPKFIAQALPQSKGDVRKALNDIRLFKEQYGITDLRIEIANANATMSTLNKEITIAASELAAETAKLERLQALVGDIDIKGSMMLQELQELDDRLAIQRTRFNENNPVIVDLKQRRQALFKIFQPRLKKSLNGDPQSLGRIVKLEPTGVQAKLVLEYVNGKYRQTGLQKRISALVYVVDAYKQRMQAIPKLEQQLDQLQNALDTAKRSG